MATLDGGVITIMATAVVEDDPSSLSSSSQSVMTPSKSRKKRIDVSKKQQDDLSFFFCENGNSNTTTHKNYWSDRFAATSSSSTANSSIKSTIKMSQDDNVVVMTVASSTSPLPCMEIEPSPPPTPGPTSSTDLLKARAEEEEEKSKHDQDSIMSIPRRRSTLSMAIASHNEMIDDVIENDTDPSRVKARRKTDPGSQKEKINPLELILRNIANLLFKDREGVDTDVDPNVHPNENRRSLVATSADPSSVSSEECSFLPGLRNIIREWRRRELRCRIESNLSVLQRARMDSQRASAAAARARRQESLRSLNEFGVTLFAPLDAAFPMDDMDGVGGESMTDVTKLRSDSVDGDDDDSDSDDFGGLFFLGRFLSERSGGERHHDSSSSCSSSSSRDKGAHSDTEMYDSDMEFTIQVEPEDEEVLESTPRILTHSMMEQISFGLPTSLRLKNWVRLFSVARDGDSFVTFLRKVKGYGDTIVVALTGDGEIVGGFADAAWERLKNGQDGSSFFGTGASFLFTCASPMEEEQSNKMHDYQDNEWRETPTTTIVPPYQPPSGVSRTDMDVGNTDPQVVTRYSWKGKNHYNQLCHTGEGRLAMGGGGFSSSFGFCVQDNFTRGTTGPCETYGTDGPLTLCGDQFQILDFEVYGFKYPW